ncbi:MAG: AbrB/MazE/SpoVT family DNA-binding domain-containing protein [Nitrospirota bacterium]
MLVSVVQIGNSRGIRLPKAILDQLSITDKLDLEIENSQIILKPIPRNPREGWDAAFKKMSAEGEDQLIIPEEIPAKDFEWEW